jgi:hypothetical protein
MAPRRWTDGATCAIGSRGQFQRADERRAVKNRGQDDKIDSIAAFFAGRAGSILAKVLSITSMPARLTYITHTSPLAVRSRKQLVSRDVPIWQLQAPAQGLPVAFVDGGEGGLMVHVELSSEPLAGALHRVESRCASGRLLFAGQAAAEGRVLAIAVEAQDALRDPRRPMRAGIFWTLSRACADQPDVVLATQSTPFELYWLPEDMRESFPSGIPIELLRALGGLDISVRSLAARGLRRLGAA